MSLVRPRLREASAALPVCTSFSCREDLTEREHTMLHALEKDVITARHATRPLLPIFKPGRGQFYFAILQQDCPERDEFKHCAYRVSALVLEHDELDNVASIEKVLKRLQLRHNIRINGLERSTGRIPYLKYHIDLEAA